MPKYNIKKFIQVMRPIPKNWKTDIYGIPFIEKDDLPISEMQNTLFLINPNNLSKNDVDKGRKIVHSFLYDDKLEKEYKNPLKFIAKISGYYGATSLDFSMHKGMKIWQIIEATGKNRWFGRFLQSYGIKVFPTVGWVDEKTYDICFAGLRDGSTFIISTLGTNNKSSRDMFLNGLYELRKRFPNSRQICVGQYIKGIPNDVCIIPYEESFGGSKQLSKRNQMHLLNWDGSISKEII